MHQREIKSGDLKFDSFRSEQFALNTDIANKIYIAGSDQIWNPNNYQGKFFLDFIADNSIKASYAASMGIVKAEQDKIDKVGKSISSFDAISVREEDVKKLLQKYVQNSITVNVDSTLLLTKQNWRELEKQVNEIKNDYVLVYLLHVPKDINRTIRRIRKITNKKILLIDRIGILRYVVHADYVISDIGPKEFIWLFDHASYVVTSSFHGTVFSIIFEKKFLPLINPSAPSRINNLLQLLDISYASSQEILFPGIDYCSVRKIIEKEKHRSFTYLQSVIGLRRG